MNRKCIIEKINENKKSLLLILAYALFASTTYELFNRPFGNVRNLKMPIDDLIPMVKELIIVYHTYFPMIILSAYLTFKYNNKSYLHFIVSLFLAQIASYFIYVTFQTYVPRYDTSLLGDDLFSKIIKITYAIDNTYSGMPSMHVCNMTLSCIFFSKLEISKIYRVMAIAFMILIAATTVLVKQHVFIDIPTGFIHAIIFYVISKHVLEIYRRKKCQH